MAAYLRFFFVQAKKMPIRAVRKDKAFINRSVPNIFGFLTKENTKIRKPSQDLWRELKPSPFPVQPYPRIDPEAWFTYRKKDGKIKRVTLAAYQKGKTMRISKEKS